MDKLTGSRVQEMAARLVFGGQLVQNNYRSVIAEALVASSLADDKSWRHCSSDWKGWDFEHDNRCRLEVKQSAEVQSWKQATPRRRSFSIAASQGYWDDADIWVADPRRKAAIYVFAHHWVRDRAVADHREPTQWHFYVVSADALPESGKSIALGKVRTLARASDLAGLQAEIAKVHQCWIAKLF